jgi:hypothetical protein
VSVGASAVLLAVLLWFGAELLTSGGQAGLAERLLGGLQTLWPVLVILSCRLNRSATHPPGRPGSQVSVHLRSIYAKLQVRDRSYPDQRAPRRHGAVRVPGHGPAPARRVHSAHRPAGPVGAVWRAGRDRGLGLDLLEVRQLTPDRESPGSGDSRSP